MGYASQSGFTSRANSALGVIDQIVNDTSLPAEVRMVRIAAVMAGEPVLTDPMAKRAREQSLAMARRDRGAGYWVHR